MTLSDRLELVKQQYGGYAELGRITGLCNESIRRWCQSGRPPVEFLVALRRQADISPDWLLHGEGPADVRERMAWLMSQASVSELLAVVGQRIAMLESVVAEHSVPQSNDNVVASSNRQAVPHSSFQTGCSLGPSVTIDRRSTPPRQASVGQ